VASEHSDPLTVAQHLSAVADSPTFRPTLGDFPIVVDLLADLVANGVLDQAAAVTLAARLTGEPVWLLVPTEHDGRELAYQHRLPARLARHVTPRRGYQFRGTQPRLWLVHDDFLRTGDPRDLAVAARLLADLRHAALTTANPLCHH
jgi:hypothetical protein